MTREDIITQTAADILSRLPPNFDIEAVSMRYPVKYEESMNTVLVQECIRYQNLLLEMKRTLTALQKALKGLVVMSGDLEMMGVSMFNQKVPVIWEAKAYPSMKPLAAWVVELLERLVFTSGWVADGNPDVYWIAGFFFPQAFLTGTLQNFARKYQLPIDTIGFNYWMKPEAWETINEKPKDGCYIRGLYAEGARWNYETAFLGESHPKELYTEMPVIHLDPQADRKVPEGGIYRCPVYKILSRQGMLSTTGHSTNFIAWIEVPSDAHDIKNNLGMTDQDKWIKAGVACFCSLKF